MKKKNNIEYLQLNNAENSEDFDIEHKKILSCSIWKLILKRKN